MKRHGQLWERITDIGNLKLAHYKAALHKKFMRSVRALENNAEASLLSIQESLLDKTFATSAYTERIVYEPKQRIIYVLPFAPDRIVQRALMNVLIPIWDKLFISDSYACRDGKGIHAGSVRTMEYVRRNKYVLKCDISKFYPSIDQELLLSVIANPEMFDRVKRAWAIWLLANSSYGVCWIRYSAMTAPAASARSCRISARRSR